jgi:hypothetical protein
VSPHCAIQNLNGDTQQSLLQCSQIACVGYDALDISEQKLENFVGSLILSEISISWFENKLFIVQ